jgi:hypothetical protein
MTARRLVAVVGAASRRWAVLAAGGPAPGQETTEARIRDLGRVIERRRRPLDAPR